MTHVTGSRDLVTPAARGLGSRYARSLLGGHLRRALRFVAVVDGKQSVSEWSKKLLPRESVCVMDFSGREEPQGAAGSGLEQMPSAANQFSYVGEEDDLSDARNSQSPDSGRDRRNGTRSGKPRPAHNRQPRETDYYLRILVPPTMVGAIIGKEGKKIKDLTEKTRTDITVHKKDEKGPFAKVVEIVGNPAQCTEANLNIHRIMRAETDPAKRSSSIMMRVLVHSGVAARVIGRGHVQLKRIMQQTPDVAVKALREDYNPLNPMDRVITVQCQLPSEQLILNEDTMLSQAEEDALLKCSEAESLISGRAYELLNCARMPFWQSPHTVFMPHHSQPPWPQMGGHTFNSPPNNPFLPHWFQGVFGNVSQGYMHLAQVPVKVHLTFPSKFAGPLIGKKASNLAHIKKFSGASRVHVLPKDRDAPERYIEIIGTPLQQYFAQHCVYCKLAEEGYKTNSDSVGELKLKTEMFIPLKGNKDQPNFIGRFIGREGHNVKELQKQTGVRIKVETSNENTENKEAVIIFEESFATGQRAQMQILEAIERCQCPPLRRQAPYS